MATGQYIGVNGVARKVVSPYVGVEGVARNVKNGYVGVDGVARLFFAPERGNVVLEVEKITSDTYANDTQYTAEEFILLDIYPKTNGTVKVTYGGLTKTITDTSGAEEPNAQQVFFGTFNGVSDSVATPSSGELTIEGDYYAFGCGAYRCSNKDTMYNCTCVTAICDFGKVEQIPDQAFNAGTRAGSASYFVLTGELIISDPIKTIGEAAFSDHDITDVTLSNSVTFIGNAAFGRCPMLKTVSILATIPPTLGIRLADGKYAQFMDNMNSDAIYLESIIVPKGCGSVYKAAEGWSTYANYIVEAT